MGKEQGKRILFLECLLGNGFTDCLFLISTFVNTPEHFFDAFALLPQPIASLPKQQFQAGTLEIPT